MYDTKYMQQRKIAERWPEPHLLRPNEAMGRNVNIFLRAFSSDPFANGP